MYNFFVLGLVPGTDIQITFAMWLESTLLLAGSVYLLYYHASRRRVVLPPTLSPEANERITQLARQGQLIRRIAAVLVTNSAGSR